MYNLMQDIRYAARTLRRNPGFTTVAVLALALGIGANTAVFTVVNGVLLRPLPFAQSERLFLVSYTSPGGPIDFGPAMVDGDYIAFRSQDRLFEHLAAYNSSSGNLTGAGEPLHLPYSAVSADFFSLLGVHAAIGRTFLPGEDEPGHDQLALLSDKLWRSRFGGNPGIVGKPITLDGISRTVVGVMPAGFAFPNERELWTPLTIQLDPRRSILLPVLGRLKPGVSKRQAQAELETLATRFPRRPGDDRHDEQAAILPLIELLVRNVRKSLWIFTGAVAFVLLIACANVANLLLARAAGRQQEMAVRTAVGARRWQLIRQLLVESLMVSLAGGSAGIILALWGVPALIALAPVDTIPRAEQIRIDAWALAFTIGISIVMGFLFGLAPAFHATRRELRESLGASGRSITGRNEVLRNSLAVAEIALALVLLTGAGLMLNSFWRLRSVKPGFRPENVLTMTVELPDSAYHTVPQMQRFHEDMLAKLSRLPGVTGAGAVNNKPLGGLLEKGDFQLEGGRQLPRGYMTDKLCVSPAYFRALGIEMIRGRDFTPRDNAAAPGVAIISQSVAKTLWPGEDPVGKRIAEAEHPKPEDWFTIIGVVADVRQYSLKDSDPAVYYSYLQTRQPFWLNQMTYALRAISNPERLAPAMRAVLHDVDRDQPVTTMSTMQEAIAASTAEPRFQARLLGAFSILALVLAMIGIYGVLAYSVTQRTREIGIRMALGAERADVLAMVLRRTLVLAVAGVAFGTAGALAVTRVLNKFLFHVKHNDPATFAAVAALLGLAAVAAGLIPARRATKVDPMVALRYE